MDEFYEEQERALLASLASSDDPYVSAIENVRAVLRDAIAAALITQGHELPPVLDGLETPDPEMAGIKARETLIEEQWAIARMADTDPDEARRLVSAVASSSLVVEALVDSPATPPELLWLLGRIATMPYMPEDDVDVERGEMLLARVSSGEVGGLDEIAATLRSDVPAIVAVIRAIPAARGDFIDLFDKRPGLLTSIGTDPELAPLLGVVNELVAISRLGAYTDRPGG